ncbi:class I SAM-dependent methyltransferase [Halobacterium wangiae]|uniref:class I SAM-dependent methyltransferase n=1 Tax=Halobacterium wangiae TaxID=2902623 RepID=UPI001E3B590C|nr:methyltransferase domain-containing protein [Halobacterium wangiae]
MTVAETQTFYARWARAYDWFSRLLPGLGSLRSEATDALALTAGDTVVDLGCGTGANLGYLRERVGPEGTVVGVDLTPRMLSQARAGVERAGWRNVHLVRGDAARPPVDDVDGILGSFVVGLLADPVDGIREWVDRLAPGGHVAVLEAGRSDRRFARRLNRLFDAFVAAGSPGESQSDPGAELDRQIDDARGAMAQYARLTFDERRAGGFVRLFAAQSRS